LKKLVVALSFVCALFVSVGAVRPAAAQTAEGWLFPKAGDFYLSPINLGTAVYTGDFPETKATFMLFTDFDYHVTPNIALGALVNIGFGSRFTGFDFGPQFKYKFKIESSSHVPYLRGALPMRMGVFSADEFGVGSLTSVGIGVLLGGGYRYWFHRRVGVGCDLSIVPTFLFSGGGSFVFGINFSVGVELKL